MHGRCDGGAALMLAAKSVIQAASVMRRYDATSFIVRLNNALARRAIEAWRSARKYEMPSATIAMRLRRGDKSKRCRRQQIRSHSPNGEEMFNINSGRPWAWPMISEIGAMPIGLPGHRHAATFLFNNIMPIKGNAIIIMPHNVNAHRRGLLPPCQLWRSARRQPHAMIFIAGRRVIETHVTNADDISLHEY